MNLLPIFIAIASVQTPTLTLDEAVNLGIKQAFAVRQAGVQEGKASDLVAQTKSTAGLSINLNGSVSGTGYRDQGQTFGGSPPTWSRILQLEINQVIDISGAIRKAIAGVKLNQASASLRLLSEQIDVKAQVRAAYYTAVLAEEAVGIQREARAAAQARLDKANIRYRNDAIPKFDVIRFEADLRRADQAVIESQQGADLAKQQLNNLIGRAIDTPFNLEKFSGHKDLNRPGDELVVLALTQRLDLKAAEATVASLKKAVEVQEKGLAPKVLASASHTEAFDPQFGQAKGTSQAGISVSVPLFDSGSNRAKVKAAKRDVDQAEILLEQARLGAALEVRASLTRLSSARESFLTAQKTEELVKEALRLSELRYAEGIGLLVDVTTAQSELTQARYAMVTAYYQYLTAYAALQKAVGLDDLTLPNLVKPL